MASALLAALVGHDVVIEMIRLSDRLQAEFDPAASELTVTV
jgi:hypothetical protein